MKKILQLFAKKIMPTLSTSKYLDDQLLIKGIEFYKNKNLDSAAKTFQECINKDKNPYAIYFLGLCYLNGIGVKVDTIKSTELFKEALPKLKKQEESNAQFIIGECYYTGNGVEQSYTEAVKWWTLAAKQGFTTAQYNLGMCYLNGNGVEQSLEEAIKWLSLAAEQGYADAQYILGICYLKGDGTEPSIEEAKKWFKRAAEQGNKDAKEIMKKI